MDAERAEVPTGILIGGQVGEGKTAPWRIVDPKAYYGVEVTTTGQAIELVREALDIVKPWPEVIEVHDPLTTDLSFIEPDDISGYLYTVTRAQAAKMKAIRAAVRMELQTRRILVRLPDLLLVSDGGAAVSVWDEAVRQVRTER